MSFSLKVICYRLFGAKADEAKLVYLAVHRVFVEVFKGDENLSEGALAALYKRHVVGDNMIGVETYESTNSRDWHPLLFAEGCHYGNLIELQVNYPKPPEGFAVAKTVAKRYVGMLF